MPHFPNQPDNHAKEASGAQVERYQGLAIIDAAGTRHEPGCLLVEQSRGAAQESSVESRRLARVLAVGTPDEVDSHPLAARAVRVDRPDSVLIPGLVNAHTHLDLTHLGPLPHDPRAGFVAWVDQIRAGRRTEPAEIADAVQLGIERSLAGGTVAVGDIAGAVNRVMTTVPFVALAASPLLGVSFAEYFGIGKSEKESIEQLERFVTEEAARTPRVSDCNGIRLGLQPHAPYTVGPSLYRQTAQLARAHSIPVSTHLAETPEEHAFIVHGTGPQRSFLERLGLWDDAILEWAGQSPAPIEHLAAILQENPMLVAHANDASDVDIKTLAKTGTSVAYCPHASAYFDAPSHFGPHRYREMLDAGVNVALGTDSIVNLPSALAESRISVLDEMRLLFQRDRADPGMLLKMATLNGALALGLDPEWFSFSVGSPLAGLVSVRAETGSGDPLAAALSTWDPPELLVAPALR